MGTGDHATCKRELVIEVPAEVVRAEADKVTAAFQRRARVPGFRPGKTPAAIVRQRFTDEIRDELLHRVVPDYFQQRVREENLDPVEAPHISDVHLDLEAHEPLRFKAVFEVMPSFDLQDYEGLDIDVTEPQVSDDEIEEALKRLQDQNATYSPVEGRVLQDGDFADISFEGRPASEGEEPGAAKPGETVKVDEIMAEIGGPGTIAEFTENLRGAGPGDVRDFNVTYPDDYSDRRLAGRTMRYTVRVNAVKEKQVPELNDDFARDLGDFQTIDDIRRHVRDTMFDEKRRHAEQEAKDKLLERLLALHDFPVPEALVERQVKTRMERTIRQLAQQGVNPAQLKVDWARVRASHREGAERDVRSALILERIAERENVEVGDEDVQREIEGMVQQVRPKDAAAVRARLTKPEAVDNIKSRVRSDRTLDIVYRKARKTSRAGSEVVS